MPNLSLLTHTDKIITLITSVLSVLVASGVLDAGQSDAITGAVSGVLALIAALVVKPLGPAA